MSGSSKDSEELRAWRQRICGLVWTAMLLFFMQASPVVGQTDEEIEQVFWQSVECESARQVQAYLEVYPTGRYVAEAHACLEQQRLREEREIEEVFWRSVECKSARQVELYLETYPNGAYLVGAWACLEGQLGLERADRILVQQGLTELDYSAGVADGLFGPETRQTIWAWQEEKGFAATGYLTREQAETLMAQGREAVAEQRQREEVRRQAEVERVAREADDTAYAEARRIATAMAYEAYLSAYPQGRHADEARTRQRAEAERRTREREEQRTRRAAQRAECEAEASEWPELNLNQQNDLQQKWQTTSACLTECVRTYPHPSECEAEQEALREATRSLDYQQQPLDLFANRIAGLLFGGETLLDVMEEEVQKATSALNACQARARENENEMRTCMTRCCAEATGYTASVD